MRKRIFKGRLITLYLERERLPSGYIANLEVIKHPGAVLIVPFLNKDRIVLIRQFRPVISSYIWELPAGTLHKNETPLNCAKREIIEETGYKAKDWKTLGYIYPAPGYTTEKILIFEAHGLKKVEFKKEEDEIIAPKCFSKKAVKRLFNQGGIADAKTICALKLAKVI